MKNTIWAIILRHIYLFRRSIDKMVDAFYWITIDLLLWGITSIYILKLAPNSSQLMFMFISGVLLWNVAYRGQVDISMGLLEELWNKNLINLFVSPLTFKDWISSLIFISIIKSLVSLTFGSILGYFLYRVGILDLFPHLIVFIALLMMTGWWLGLFISGIILRFGTRVQALSWTLVWIVSPFSAIYYPLDILPMWAQMLSKIFPTSYIFEESRNLLYNGQVNYSNLGISAVLNVIYLIASFYFINSSFKKVLAKGLVKIY